MLAGRRAGIMFVVVAAVIGCGDKSRFVAIEPNVDADLRIAITIPSTGQRQIAPLKRDEPLTYPLSEPFSGGHDLRVVIVAFARADLDRAYPAIRSRSLDDLKSILRPTFGQPEPGGYEIPKPLRILSARIASGGPTDVKYKELTQADLEQDPQARFVFKLSADIACPPGENALRIFARGDPSRVCTFQRDATCTWVRSPDTSCPYLADILGRAIDPGMRFFEDPTRVLKANDLVCSEVSEKQLGESRRFDCGSAVISVQETPRATNDAPWVPVRKGSTQSFVAGGTFVEAKHGALYAYPMDNAVYLYRMTVLAGGDLNPFDVRYQFPGAGPRIRINGLGTLNRMTTNPAHDLVVVDGTTGTSVLIKDDNVGTGSEVPSFYKFPIDVPQSVNPTAMRAGNVVANSGTNLLALVENGVAALSVSGTTVVKTNQTAPGVVTFTRDDDPKIVVGRKRGEDRALVWLKDGRVFMFDGTGAVKLAGCRIEGKIMTMTETMQLVRRPAGERFALELIDMAQAEDLGSCMVTPVRYLVPPNVQAVTGSLELDSDAYIASLGRTCLRYQYDRDVGILDLATGLSQAITLPAASQTSLLFEDDSGIAIWGLFAPRNRALFDQVSIPILKPPMQ